jgi:rhodanese-related sulfurtransferase
MRRFAATVLLLVTVSAGAGGLAGCAGSGGDGGNGAHLSVSAFAERTQQAGTVVLDVRTSAEFAAGHLANAVNIDVNMGDFAQKIGALDKNSTYAVYCHSGRRSGIALQQLESAGFTHVADLSGGVSAWTAGGRLLVTGS